MSENSEIALATASDYGKILHFLTSTDADRFIFRFMSRAQFQELDAFFLANKPEIFFLLLNLAFILLYFLALIASSIKSKRRRENVSVHERRTSKQNCYEEKLAIWGRRNVDGANLIQKLWKLPASRKTFRKLNRTCGNFCLEVPDIRMKGNLRLWRLFARWKRRRRESLVGRMERKEKSRYTINWISRYTLHKTFIMGHENHRCKKASQLRHL